MPENPYEAPKAHLSDPAETGPVQLASRGKRLLGAIIDGLIGFGVVLDHSRIHAEPKRPDAGEVVGQDTDRFRENPCA